MTSKARAAALVPQSRRLLADWWPLALGLLLLVLAGVMTIRMVRMNAQHNEMVVHTLEVLGTAAEINAQVTEANSAQRGYLLTGHPVFRQRFEESRSKALEGVQRLILLTRDNPEQLPRIEELEDALMARIYEWNTAAALINSGQTRAAIDRSLIGLELTEDFRGVLAKLSAEERSLLSERQARADTSGNWLLVYGVGGLGLAAMLVGLSISALRQRARQLEQANAEIRELLAGLEQRVAERTADLADANEEIQRFAYIISHDLRSPLVNIMGFSSELDEVQAHAATLVERLDREAPASITPAERAALATDLPEAIGFIRASTARMDGLIKAILSLSRTGQRTLAPEELDLGTLFAALAVTLSARLSESGTRLEIGPMPSLESDRLSLEQIFANLLDNAVKYRREDVEPRIDVTAEDLGSRVRVTVADNGRGIAPHDRERVFELFRRAGTQDRQGEGIGLAHVRALARRLGGSITLDASPSGGSSFTVTLPKSLPRTIAAQE